MPIAVLTALFWKLYEDTAATIDKPFPTQGSWMRRTAKLQRDDALRLELVTCHFRALNRGVSRKKAEGHSGFNSKLPSPRTSSPPDKFWNKPSKSHSGPSMVRRG